MRNLQSGFTLIELMIVVAILGIIASLAIPAYQRYVIRTQIGEGLTLATAAKEAVTEYRSNRGGWPADNAAAALAPGNTITGDFTEHVEVTNNVIEIQYGLKAHPDITNGTVTLTATDNNGSISWTCSNGVIIRTEHLPAVCR